jgi:hypothetical protein
MNNDSSCGRSGCILGRVQFTRGLAELRPLTVGYSSQLQLCHRAE